MDALERIEVAIRAVINNHMSLKYGSQWYVDYTHFQRKKGFDHLKFIDIVKKETGYSGNSGGPAFCRNYFRKYCDPVLPPSWMVAEVLPIGTWSRIYSTLTEPKDRKKSQTSLK
jgi:abortive infection bacteriophage resistance protein